MTYTHQQNAKWCRRTNEYESTRKNQSNAKKIYRSKQAILDVVFKIICYINSQSSLIVIDTETSIDRVCELTNQLTIIHYIYLDVGISNIQVIINNYIIHVEDE